MPAIDAIMQKVLDAVPFRLAPDEGVETARKAFRDLPRRPILPEVRAEDRSIDGPGGRIPVRVYWPPRAAGAGTAPPALVYFHGGGFALGDLDTYDGTARQHAVGADAVVVSVDYRLAPEHPHPAAVEDAYAATRWVAENAGDIGADPGRVAVAGDSAGANLAAVVAQLARDDSDFDGPDLAFQLLWYPPALFDVTLPSFTENAEAPILDLKAMAVFNAWYAGDADMSDAPATLAPGRATDLAGLPPAHVSVAGHDPLRDDGLRFAELLSAAGVPVTIDHAETLVHGFIAYAGVVPAATDAMERGLAALRAALHG